MYLEKLFISNFRSIKYIELSFQKGLNIIIGENNAGKSTIIDVLRICLNIGRQYRDIGVVKDEDFHIDKTKICDVADPIHFKLIFKKEDKDDVHYFQSLIYQDPENPKYQDFRMDFIYELEISEKGTKSLKYHSFGGGMEGRHIEPIEAQNLFYTYLAPLRNAEQELRPYARENKVTSLFQELGEYNSLDDQGKSISKKLDDNERISLAGKLEEVINDKAWTGLLLTGQELINEHLEKADISKKESKIQLRLLEHKYENIVKAITTKKPVYSKELLVDGNEGRQKYFEVSQNGLGENNLIYSSAVLGDLKNRRKERIEHYYALLIEEPEAHLHPQRQNTFFNYLNNLQDLGIQLFITSHSPTITAKSDLDSLVVIQNQGNKNSPFIVRNSDLSTPNKSHLRKFLDVTKSQLFFSNGTILVEGISEALLLPVLAKIENPLYDLEKNGIEIVNIAGVAFEAFAKLYNNKEEDKRLASKCAILSDNDKGLIAAKHFISAEKNVDERTANGLFHALKGGEIIDATNRIVNFDPLHTDVSNDFGVNEQFIRATLSGRVNELSARALNAAEYQEGNLMVKLAEYTFEFELMVASENNYDKIISVYQKMHPDTVFLEKKEPMRQRCFDFLRKLNSNKDKAAFAEKFSFFLEDKNNNHDFTVPAYIVEAIQWVLNISKLHGV